jgi:hypothetical protein
MKKLLLIQCVADRPEAQQSVAERLKRHPIAAPVAPAATPISDPFEGKTGLELLTAALAEEFSQG